MMAMRLCIVGLVVYSSFSVIRNDEKAAGALKTTVKAYDNWKQPVNEEGFSSLMLIYL